MLSRTGVPSVAGAQTGKEMAIGLLKLAAEIEHALMVQYLFAATSLQAPTAQEHRTRIMESRSRRWGT